jgi:hypothetical protein
MDNFKERLQTLTDGPIWAMLNQIEEPAKEN